MLGSGKERVEHIACDFLNDSEDIGRKIKGQIAKADVIFFYSYLQPGKTPFLSTDNAAAEALQPRSQALLLGQMHKNS